MSVSLLFAAVAGAIVVWCFLLQRLKTKPWMEQGVIEDRGGAVDVPAARVGLWVFLAVVTSFFGLFTIVYNMRAQFPDWRPLPDPGLLWFNTGLLILASVALQRARGAAAREDLAGLKPNLTAAGVLTLAFLAGQSIVWRQLSSAGYFIATNPADAFFYILTGLHGLHLAGGLWFWARAAAPVWKGLESRPLAEVAGVRLSVALCSVYWHYLLLVWLILFGLLLST